MKFIREMLAHKNKTTTILTSMILDAKGWSAGKIAPEVVPPAPGLSVRLGSADELGMDVLGAPRVLCKRHG